MIRGIEGGNARGARLQYFVSARFAGSVGEYEVVRGNACSHYIQEDRKWELVIMSLGIPPGMKMCYFQTSEWGMVIGKWLMDHG